MQIADEPLAEWRVELLDLAFEAATDIPVNPHIKDRSRSQEAVAAACFELHQPQRALAYIKRIDNWRRGAGFADFAFYCTQHGDIARMKKYLDLAEQIAAGEDTEWRRDVIRVKIAKSHAWLGRAEAARQFEAGVIDAEAGKVEAVFAMRAEAPEFEQRLAVVDRAVATQNFDRIRNALHAAVQLYDRFYDVAQWRTVVAEKIRSGLRHLPIMVRIKLLMELADAALRHDDPAEALALVDEADRMLEAHEWRPEHRLPLLARLAGLRYEAGDTARARHDLDAALHAYDEQVHLIINIDRADTLRSIAEAFVRLGENTSALAVYRRAVEAGTENPNARPRAEDLSATCVSMAVNGVRPDTELWTRLHGIDEGLRSPW